MAQRKHCDGAVFMRLRKATIRSHAEVVTLVKMALEVWAAAVAFSLAAIVAYLVAGAAVSALTVVSEFCRSRACARDALPLGALARWSSAAELVEIDKNLDRLWAEERGPAFDRRAC